ncbi:WXG100-like domain-containing protein [Nocardia sp. NPDC003963]
MSLYLPPDLRWLGWIAGAIWPDGDEDEAWAVAGVWQDGSTDLKALLAEIDEAKQATMAAYPEGAARDEMGARYDQLRSGVRSLEQLATSMEAQYGSTFDMGTELQATKLTIIVTLCWLAIEIAWAWLFPPTAPAVEAAAIASTRSYLKVIQDFVQKTIANIATRAGAPVAKRHFWKELAKGNLVAPTAKGWGVYGARAAEGAVVPMAINGSIQTGQIADGKRRSFNGSEFGLSVLGGAAGAVPARELGRYLGEGIEKVAGKYLNNVAGRTANGMFIGAVADGFGAVFGNLATALAAGGDFSAFTNGPGWVGNFAQGALVGGARGASAFNSYVPKASAGNSTDGFTNMAAFRKDSWLRGNLWRFEKYEGPGLFAPGPDSSFVIRTSGNASVTTAGGGSGDTGGTGGGLHSNGGTGGGQNNGGTGGGQNNGGTGGGHQNGPVALGPGGPQSAPNWSNTMPQHAWFTPAGETSNVGGNNFGGEFGHNPGGNNFGNDFNGGFGNDYRNDFNGEFGNDYRNDFNGEFGNYYGGDGYGPPGQPGGLGPVAPQYGGFDTTFGNDPVFGYPRSESDADSFLERPVSPLSESESAGGPGNPRSHWSESDAESFIERPVSPLEHGNDSAHGGTSGQPGLGVNNQGSGPLSQPAPTPQQQPPAPPQQAPPGSSQQPPAHQTSTPAQQGQQQPAPNFSRPSPYAGAAPNGTGITGDRSIAASQQHGPPPQHPVVRPPGGEGPVVNRRPGDPDWLTPSRPAPVPPGGEGPPVNRRPGDSDWLTPSRPAPVPPGGEGPSVNRRPGDSDWLTPSRPAPVPPGGEGPPVNRRPGDSDWLTPSRPAPVPPGGEGPPVNRRPGDPDWMTPSRPAPAPPGPAREWWEVQGLERNSRAHYEAARARFAADPDNHHFLGEGKDVRGKPRPQRWPMKVPYPIDEFQAPDDPGDSWLPENAVPPEGDPADQPPDDQPPDDQPPDDQPTEPPVVHPDAVVDPTATIGPGAEVKAGAVVGENATVGAGAVLEPGAEVKAGATVGDGAVIGPGVVVHEGAVVGKGAVVHEGAVILPGAVVPDGAVVEAGQVVGGDADPGNGSSVDVPFTLK